MSKLEANEARKPKKIRTPKVSSVGKPQYTIDQKCHYKQFYSLFAAKDSRDLLY
jgi:hypothetical protein